MHALHQGKGHGGQGTPKRNSLVPELLIVASTLILVWFFRRLLADAQHSDIELTTLIPLFLAVVGLAVAAALLALGQASRSARRLDGPSQRLILAIKRTRRGDLAHRVHLRTGDEMKPIAAECNRLLDGLNANPPAGAKTGNDLIEGAATERLTALNEECDDIEETDDATPMEIENVVAQFDD